MPPSDSVSGDGLEVTRAVAEAAAPPHDARSMALVQARLFGVVSDAARVGRYELLQKLGEGGMGEVYEARDDEGRRVALKLIRPAARSDAASETRLRREAHALTRLDHPNVVSVLELGSDEGRRFMAMELVDGPRLDRFIEQRAPGWRQLVEVFIGAGRGLAAAHAVGLVHRDFKPANVILDRERTPKVVDFGLVRALGGASEQLGDEDRAQLERSAFASVTKTGALVGTPAYMAPEQLRGERADARTDQFNFCVALFESLYRVRPFLGLYLNELATNVLEGRVTVRPSDTEVPMAVHEVVLRGLSVDPEQRWPAMDALLDALQHAALGSTLSRGRGRGWRLGAVVLGLAVTLVVAIASLARCS